MKQVNFLKIRSKCLAIMLSLCAIFSMAFYPAKVFAAETTPNDQVVEDEQEQPVIVIQRIGDADESYAGPITTQETTTYLDVRGSLAPGESKSGTFTLTKWRTSFSVIGCASNTGGSLYISFVSAAHSLPCDGVARVLERDTNWRSGTYSYSIYNGTGNTVAYAFGVFEYN